MVAHISPASTHFEESRTTLLYAYRAKNIKTRVRRPPVPARALPHSAPSGWSGRVLACPFLACLGLWLLPPYRARSCLGAYFLPDEDAGIGLSALSSPSSRRTLSP